jgi:hypothetical protein
MTSEPTVPVPQQPAPAEFPITIEEFCIRLSKGAAQPELIGAFHNVEVRAGRLRDKQSAYAARWTAFPTQPA